jgi:hypothetical protein
MKELLRVCQKERDSFCATPILLIDSTKDKPSLISQHVQFALLSAGLRSTSTQPSSGHFPLVQDVQATADFAKRLGAATIVGVGDQGAMELAKAVAQEYTTFDQLLLVPSTLGASMATATAHSLFLDPEEEVLVPRPSSNIQSLREGLETHLILPQLSRSKEDPDQIISSLSAALVLGLDALYRGNYGISANDDREEHLKMIQSTADLLDQMIRHGYADSWEDEAQNCMRWAGSTISFGYSSSGHRSIPVALACSLIPTALSEHSYVDYLSCFLPGMLAILHDKDDLNKELTLKLSFRFKGRVPRFQLPGSSADANAMLSQVHSNGAEWNCFDASDAELSAVLRRSLSG